MTSKSQVKVIEPGYEPVHEGHPSPLTYFKVAMTLVVITAIEVVVFFFEGLSYGIIPILAILSLAKFALVIMFYMHLKFDHKLFSTMFVGGFVLAFLVIFALLGLFKWFI
ncbi:MAG: cytochrome C oxidase subunit IV family protein [Chloroflexi bacterium]|nr:cytochrome C oxidase subunit IV family protein [Chloroflexota bacterium]